MQHSHVWSLCLICFLGSLNPCRSEVVLEARFPLNATLEGREIVKTVGAAWSSGLQIVEKGNRQGSIGGWAKGTVNASESRSISLWIKAEGNATLASLPDGWEVRISTTGQVEIYQQWTIAYKALCNVIDGTWHHVAVAQTQQNSTIANTTATSVYLDGLAQPVFVYSSPLPTSDGALTLTINPDGLSTVVISDVRLYSGVLKSFEAKGLALESLTGTTPVFHSCQVLTQADWVFLGRVFTLKTCLSLCAAFPVAGLAKIDPSTAPPAADGSSMCYCAGYPPNGADVGEDLCGFAGKGEDVSLAPLKTGGEGFVAVYRKLQQTPYLNLCDGPAWDSSHEILKGGRVHIVSTHYFPHTCRFDGYSITTNTLQYTSSAIPFPATLTLWVYLDPSCSLYATILRWGTTLHLRLFNGFLQWVLSTATLTTSLKIDKGSWKHIAVQQYQSGKTVLWVNGLKAAEHTEWVGVVTMDTLRVGSDGSSSTSLLKGNLYGVKMYNKVMSDHELAGDRMGVVRRWCSSGGFDDTSGYRQHGKPEGCLSGVLTGGKRACSMNGHSASLPATTLNLPMTVSSWVKWETCDFSNAYNLTAHLSALLGWHSSLASSFVSLNKNPIGKLEVGFGTTSGTATWQYITCSDIENVWVHIAASVHTDGTVQVTMDGVNAFEGRTDLAMLQNDTSVYPSTQSRIGGRYEDGRWVGTAAQLHDVKMHTTGLSAEDVTRDISGNGLSGEWCNGESDLGEDLSVFKRRGYAGTGVTFGDAQHGKCLFDGTADACITVPMLKSRPKAVTVMAWMKLLPTGDPCWTTVDYTDPRGAVFGWFGDAAEASFGINYYMAWRERDADGVEYHTRPSWTMSHRVCDYEWHHVAVTIDADHSVTVYHDGAPVGLFIRSADSLTPDTTQTIFTHATIGCWTSPTTSTTLGHTGYLSAVKLFSRSLAPSEIVQQAGFVPGLLMQLCMGGTEDTSGWGRDGSASGAVSTLYEDYFGYATCQVEGGYLQINKIFDRPQAFTISLWTRRLQAGTACYPTDQGSWFTMVRNDFSYLELKGGGYEPRFDEGRLGGVFPTTRTTVTFTACGMSPCSNTSGWASYDFPLDTCQIWLEPCTMERTSLYIKMSLTGRSAVSMDFYNDVNCYASAAQNITKPAYQCNTCYEGIQFSKISHVPCDASEGIETDLEVRSPGYCDKSWHHLAVVVPGSRGEAHFYYDGLKTKKRNGTDSLWPITGTEYMRIGQRWDNIVNNDWTGSTETAIADFRVYNYALSQAELNEATNCRTLWVAGRGTCSAGYSQYEGLTLEQCKQLCLSTENCQAVQFPLEHRPEGCKVHDDIDSPVCSPMPSMLQLHTPVVLCSNGGMIGRYCTRGTIEDSSGYKHVTVTTGVSEATGGGCSMSSGYLSVSGSSMVHRPYSFTVTAWLRLDAACGSASGHLVFWTDGTNIQSVGVSSTGRLYFTSGDTTSTAAVTKAEVPLCTSAGLNVWRHVAVTLTTTTILSIYLDGMLVGWSGGRHDWTSGGTFEVGRANGVYYSGEMENLRVYDKALSRDDIRDIASSKGTLLGTWCSNGTFDDTTGYGRNPTVQGVALKYDYIIGDHVCWFGNSSGLMRWDAGKGSVVRPVPMSWEGLIRMTDCEGVQPLLWWGGVATRGSMLYLLNSTLAYSEVHGGAQEDITSTADVLCDLEWHHVAITIKSTGRVQLWVDGNDTTSSDGSQLTQDHPYLHNGGVIGHDMHLGAGALPSMVSCPANYTQCGTKCIRAVTTTTVSYTTAAQLCADEASLAGGEWSEHYSGRLVSVTSYDELVCVQSAVASQSWIGIAASDGMWKYSTGKEVNYWPGDVSMTYGSSLCIASKADGTWATAGCTDSLPYVCELTRSHYFRGFMKDVKLSSVVPNPGSWSGVQVLLEPGSKISPTPTITPPVYSSRCTITSISTATAGVVVTLLPVTADLVLWASGSFIENCVVLFESSTGYLQIPLVLAGIRGGEQVASLRIPFVTGAAIQLGTTPLWVKHATEDSSMRVLTNITIQHTPTPTPIVDSDFVWFRNVANWRHHPHAAVGYSADDCTTIEVGSPVRMGKAATKLQRGPGGTFTLCLKLTNTFLATNTTVSVKGDCNSNGVFLTDKGRCDCYRDEMRGFWDGDGCDTCLAYFYGPSCTRKCSDAYCSYRGVCNDMGDCVCQLGFLGARCQKDLSCDLLQKAVSSDSMHSVKRYHLQASLAEDKGAEWLEREGNATVLPTGTVQLEPGSYLSSTVNITAGSMSLWVRDVTSNGTILCVHSTGSVSSCVGVQREVLYFYVGALEAHGTTPASTLNDHQWHSIAVTWGLGTHIQLFLNGALEAETAGNTTLPFCEGEGCVLKVGGLGMSVKDVRLYYSALDKVTAGEVWEGGITVADCPGQCEADTTLGVFTFAGEMNAGTLKGTANHTVVSSYLTLDGESFFETQVAAPQDAWSVSVWFRTSEASPGCLYAAATTAPSLPPIDYHYMLSSTNGSKVNAYDTTALQVISSAAVTVSFYVEYTATAGSTYTIFRRMKGGSGWTFTATVSSGGSSVTLQASYLTSSVSVALNSVAGNVYRYHVAVRLYGSGAAFELWLDGVQRATTSYTVGSTVPNGPLEVGDGFEGFVRQFRVYHRILDGTELAALHEVRHGVAAHTVCIADGTVIGNIYSTLATREVTGGAVTTDTWHHIAHVFSPLGHLLYVDGIASTGVDWSMSRPVPVPSAYVYAGHGRPPVLHDHDFYFFKGSLSDLRVLSRAITASEVATLSAARNKGSLENSVIPSVSSSETTVKLPRGLVVRKFPTGKRP